MNGNLNENDELRFLSLTESNFRVIKDVQKNLINDSELQMQIKKIKSHEWVKMMEK